MKITLNKKNFNNVRDFTAYLETNYEQDKLVSGEVTLSLDCDDFSQENYMELVEFFLNPERPRIYKFEFPPQQKSYQTACDDVYLTCKRQKFSREFQKQIIESTNPTIPSQPYIHKIRKTKKNWIEGTKGPHIPLHFQYQIPDHQEHQPQKLKAVLRKRKNQEETQYQYPDERSLLAFNSELFPTDKRTITGSYNQFNLMKKESGSIGHQTQFHYLMNSRRLPDLMNSISLPEQRQTAFIFFLTHLTGNDSPKLKLIKRLLHAVPLSDLNYQGLAQVLLHTGADGVLLLLQQFKSLNDKELFKSFNELFLDKGEKYVALMSSQSLINLTKLSELTSEQKTWWLSLVMNHKKEGGSTEFNELFENYIYFLEQLEKKKLKLPLSCTLKNFGKMKNALDHLLFLINNSSDPEEQLTCLNEMDLEAAYHAIHYHQYKLVSKQMNLRFIKGKIPDYSVPITPLEVQAWLRANELPYEESVTRFYRFIGVQEWAFNLDVYQHIEQEISKSKNLSVKNKKSLLSIAALVTTGLKACTKTADPFISFRNLANELIATAGHEDMNNHLSTTLAYLSESLAHSSWKSMPTADELNQLTELLVLTQEMNAPISENHHSNLQELSSFALNFWNRYGEVALSVLDHYKRRFVIEKTNTVSIKKFSLPNLLNHLTPPSRLNHFLLNELSDPPEFLSRFIQVLSLLDDAIPEVTPGEADSEFEKKIKTLARVLHAMKAGQREQLLSFFAEINIEASYKLPSLDQLIKIVDSVTKAEEKLGTLHNEENQKACILDIVRTELPDLKIGDDPIQETTINFLNLIKQSYEEWKLDEQFSEFPDKLQGYLESWMEAHQVVLYHMHQKPMNQRLVIEALAEEEQEVKKLLESRWFAWTLSGYPEEKKQMAQLLGNEFFTQKSIMAVLKSRIDPSCHSSISAALKSLHISEEFADFLLKSVSGLNVGLPMDKALLELSQQFDAANRLINRLIRIKNQNNTEFHQCILSLTDGIKTSGKNLLTPVQINDLLTTLSEGKTGSATASLAILCKILKETPEYSDQQLQNALNEVTNLTKYQKDLGPEAYETLLRCSFTHNITQKSLFPLKGLMSLAGEDEHHCKDLFTALVQIVKKAGPEVDSQILQKLIDKTTLILQSKKAVPSLVPLLTLLMRTCNKGSNEELLCYSNIIDKLENTEELVIDMWAKILIILGDQVTENNSHLLLNVLDGLELDQHNLMEVAELFEYPPYPEIELFIKKLNGYVNDLRSFIDAFDKDPKSGRTAQQNAFGVAVKSSAQVINEQFDIAPMKQIIGDVTNILSGTSLSSQEQYDLAQQITYINAIGRDKPLTIMVGDKIAIYKDLTQISRAELRILSDTLIEKLRGPGLEAHEKLQAQLRLLSVLREQYSRATGTIVEAPELLAILISLKNHQNNLLMEIDSEEGNSIAAALFAVMQWVEADGGTVDVCAPNQNIREKNYKTHAKDFFASIGIESSCVQVDSPKGTYKVGGINYSTLGDLALYRSRAKIENENLTAFKEGHLLSSNLILYGADFSELDGRILFNIAVRAEGAEGNANNPYAWIYPLINEFIFQKQFKALHGNNAWSEEQDVEKLKEFLCGHAPTSVYKAQINSIPRDKYNLWINSAITAQQFIEGEDFVIPHSDTKHHFAVPLNQKIQQNELSYMEQQFLHARLQRENPNWEFFIGPEMDFVDSASLKDFINDYKKQGHITSISRAPSKKEKLIEQCAQFDMEVACQILPHSKTNELEKDFPRKQQDEGMAAERYSIQTVSNIQQVVLQQFQEWKEFLHLVYPKSEWKILDAELLSQREDLILSLNEQWDKCLERSVDNAVADYEIALVSIWDKQKSFLKEKANPVILEGSLNALRCNYLEGVSLQDQFQLNRLAPHQNNKELHAEKKKTRRYIESGFDVNSAMMRFELGNVDVYRDAFANNQVQLFAADISQMINKNSYLKGTLRSLLVDQVLNAPNLDVLVGFLVDYANRYANLYLPEDRHSEKFALQPIIQELLQVYQEAGLDETADLKELKKIYFDQVAAEIVVDLETSLSWAMNDNRGLVYLLQRSAVTTAANDILSATHDLKVADNLKTRKKAFKNLYRVLSKHEAQLEDLWIFSFGYKNTRTLIKETIGTLDGLTAIGSGSDELDAEFIHDCKEKSLYALMSDKLDSAIHDMEEKEPLLKNQHEWIKIKNSMNKLQNKNKTIYAFHEMYYFLSDKVEELAQKGSKLHQFATHLRGEVRTLCDAYNTHHKGLINTNKYFKNKAENLKEKLKGLDGFNVGNVSFKEGHNGFCDYFDLVIKGSGFHHLFQDFTHYNSRAVELSKERESLELRRIQATEQFSNLERLLKEQLPLLKFDAKIKTSADHFPKQFQNQVKEILDLKEWIINELPENLDDFSEGVRNSFLDRELIKKFNFPHLNKEEIDQIQNLILKIGFVDLYERIIESRKPKTTLGSITSYLSSYLVTPENMDDWRLDFDELARRPNRNLQQTLGPDLEKKWNVLATQLDKLRQNSADQIVSLEQQIAYLEDKIKEEEKKGGIYVRRINNTAELFYFENQLMTVKMNQEATRSPEKLLETNKPARMNLPQIPVNESEAIKATISVAM